MKTEPFYKLKIVAGLHKDAELFLEPDVRYCIGASDNCDVILLDSDVAEKHLCFRVSQGRIHLEQMDAKVLVDGNPVDGAPFILSNFQVVTMGEAHLAIGPANEAWPPIAPPQTHQQDDLTSVRDLVIIDHSRNLPQTVPSVGHFQRLLAVFLAWISTADKKILVTAGTFLLALSVFVFDIWRACTPMETVISGGNEHAVINPIPQKSILLTMLNGLRNAHRGTLVGAGVTEPTVPVKAGRVTETDDPVDHIRHVLRNTWGNNLTETRVDQNSIQFKGYDEQSNRQNLVLNLEQNELGQIDANGVTQTLKKKKEILSHLGDIIRVKVDVTHDMETVCQRVLKKKGVRRAKASFNIEDNSFTLQGQSDRSTISTIGEMVAKAFPNINIDNRIKTVPARARKLEISGVSTSGAPHVILKDGSKVFGGGRLNNGCTVAGIKNDHIMLNCSGAMRKHPL